MADTRKGSFTLSLQQFAQAAPEKARTVARKVALSALESVVMKTPVGDPKLWKSPPPAGYVGGRLRANWFVGLGAPNVAVVAKIDAGGQSTINAGAADIARADGDQPIYITNSLPYAIPVEYGHSSQAPTGMVRVTVAEWQGFVDQAVRSLPK